MNMSSFLASRGGGGQAGGFTNTLSAPTKNDVMVDTFAANAHTDNRGRHTDIV